VLNGKENDLNDLKDKLMKLDAENNNLKPIAKKVPELE
jgi:hypothetical protein